MSGELKSTAADRAAVLGPDWDGDGWKDRTDYAKLHRGGALRGDFVRATYYATLLLLRAQEAATREAHTANLIAYAETLPDSSHLKYDLHDLIEQRLRP